MKKILFLLFITLISCNKHSDKAESTNMNNEFKNFKYYDNVLFATVSGYENVDSLVLDKLEDSQFGSTELLENNLNYYSIIDYYNLFLSDFAQQDEVEEFIIVVFYRFNNIEFKVFGLEYEFRLKNGSDFIVSFSFKNNDYILIENDHYRFHDKRRSIEELNSKLVNVKDFKHYLIFSSTDVKRKHEQRAHLDSLVNSIINK